MAGQHVGLGDKMQACLFKDDKIRSQEMAQLCVGNLPMQPARNPRILVRGFTSRGEALPAWYARIGDNFGK